MASNDLPVYPTPQQVAYAANGQQSQPRRNTRPHTGQPGHPYSQLTLASNLPDMPTTRTYMAAQPTHQKHSQVPPQHPQQFYSQPLQVQPQQRPLVNYQYQQPQQLPPPQHPQLPLYAQHQYQPQYFQGNAPVPPPVAPSAPPPAPVPAPIQYQQFQPLAAHYQPAHLQLPHSQYSGAPIASPTSQQTPVPVTKKPPPKDRPRDNETPKMSSKQRLENELRATFERVDTDRSGRISARELSLALTNFDNTRFQDSTVRLMIKLFTNESSSSLNFEQFVSLWKYLTAYKKLFVAADVNKLGDISFGEFQRIIEQIGYKLNVDLVLHLFQKFANKDYVAQETVVVSKLKFDSFIELLVYLRKLTDIFKQYDKSLSGVATIDYLDFLFEISNLT